MRNSLLIVVFLSMSFGLMAQETVKIKEVGIAFRGLSDFGLTYKTGTNKSLWRFNALNASGSNNIQTSDSLVVSQRNMGFGFAIGKEFRKDITDKLELRYGADLSFNYTQYTSHSDDQRVLSSDTEYKSETYRPGINLVFGLNYKISDKVILGAEMLPSISYSTGPTTGNNLYYTSNGKGKTSGFNYGLSSSPLLLTLSYRF